MCERLARLVSGLPGVIVSLIRIIRHARLINAQYLAVTVDHHAKAHHSPHLPRVVGNTRFDGVPYHTTITGSPILAYSLAWSDCRVEATRDGGDHTIFIGRVEAVGFGAEGKQPLVYFANRYAGLKY